jgi:hypothetical protein
LQLGRAVLGWTHAANVGLQLRVVMLFGVKILLHMLWVRCSLISGHHWALVEVPFLWLAIVALIIGLDRKSVV